MVNMSSLINWLVWDNHFQSEPGVSVARPAGAKLVVAYRQRCVGKEG